MCAFLDPVRFPYSYAAQNLVPAIGAPTIRLTLPTSVKTWQSLTDMPTGQPVQDGRSLGLRWLG